MQFLRGRDNFGVPECPIFGMRGDLVVLSALFWGDGDNFGVPLFLGEDFGGPGTPFWGKIREYNQNLGLLSAIFMG